MPVDVTAEKRGGESSEGNIYIRKLGRNIPAKRIMRLRVNA
jgi:hypothetical protein